MIAFCSASIRSLEHRVDVVAARTGNDPSVDLGDLSDDPRSAGKRAELEELLLAEMKRLDDPYRLWNQSR